MNVLMVGTGSWYKTRRGLRSIFQQNSAHFFQVPLEVADRLAEIPLAMSFAAAHKLSKKRSHLEGATTSMAASVDAKRPCG